MRNPARVEVYRGIDEGEVCDVRTSRANYDRHVRTCAVSEGQATVSVEG